MGTTTISPDTYAELGAATVEERLCVCDCGTRHRHRDICSLIAPVPGTMCPGCQDNTNLGAPGPESDLTLDGYATAPWSAWRVLTVDQTPEPVDGFLVVNATWAGHRRGGRPAAIRTAGHITHVGIVAEIHPAAGCPDIWDDEDLTTDCFPWGAAADPARPRLAHWCLAETLELPDPIRHKIAGWMTPGACQAITAQL